MCKPVDRLDLETDTGVSLLELLGGNWGRKEKKSKKKKNVYDNCIVPCLVEKKWHHKYYSALVEFKSDISVTIFDEL